MKKNLTKILALILTLTMIVSLMVVPASGAIKVDQVGALWNYFTPGSGTFTVTDDSRVFVAATTEPTGDLLQTAQLIQRQLKAEFDGAFTELVWGSKDSAKKGDIVLVLDAASGTGADGYKLDVTETAATVTAADTDGLIYGANNLMKCFRAVGGSSISCFSGYDTPDTKQRVVMLDTGRKYYTAEWVKNFIKQISWMGYNALEIHFSEDGGFRADLWDPAYYKGKFQPKNDFSWLCGSYVQSWVKDPYRNDPNVGEYLTTAELVEICKVAKEYHIEIIPSFDSPAHMDYITWKFEQNYRANTNYSFTYNGTTYKASSTAGCINYTGTTGAESPTWPNYTTVDITDGTMSKAFVFALYEDMADFFKEYAGSTNFNIGADEVNMTDYASSLPRKWSYSQFPGYINDLNRLLNGKGYTVRMFNDFIGSTTYNRKNSKAVYDFDDNIEIVYWNSDFNPNTGNWSDPTWHVKFFWENNDGNTDNWGDGGRTMYNAIQTNTYYVLREGTSGDHRDARDPNNRNWTFYGTNEQDIYNKWYPADISEKGKYTENAADVPAESLGGAYFLIWNDYAALNTESEVWNGAKDCWDKDTYYYLFDIMASNITKMWNSDINSSDNSMGKVTYESFATVRNTVSGSANNNRTYFPGYSDNCSADSNLPAAADITKANAADKTALNAALQEGKVENTDGKYAAKSYADYESAYNAAVNVQNNADADQSAVDTARANLVAAKNALVDLTDLKNALSEDKIGNEDGTYTADSYKAYSDAYDAAKAVAEDEDAKQDAVDTALAKLNSTKAALVDRSALAELVNNKVDNADGTYTEDSYAAYSDAYDAAKAVYEKSSAAEKEITDAVNALKKAKAALKPVNVSGIEVERLADPFRVGKSVGLRIITAEAVTDVTVSLDGAAVATTTKVFKVQELDDGTKEKVWLVEFDAPAAPGTYVCTVSASAGETTVEITVG